ncbi:MAG: NTP transferase domain-containing protein [Bacteroidota bacterium]
MKFDCAVLITAAGFSGRMGVSKALLNWNQEMNFLQKLISTYSSFGCNEIIVSLNEEIFATFKEFSNSNVRFILNPHPEKERMYSVQLGLKAIKNASYCFIQAIDNPFINTKILEGIYHQKTSEKYITPTYQDQSGHPVLINRLIIDYICQMETNNKNLKDILHKFPRKKIAVEHSEILININNMDDYRNLIKPDF